MKLQSNILCIAFAIFVQTCINNGQRREEFMEQREFFNMEFLKMVVGIKKQKHLHDLHKQQNIH